MMSSFGPFWVLKFEPEQLMIRWFFFDKLDMLFFRNDIY